MVDDKTGKAIVIPKHAKFNIMTKFSYLSDLDKKIPAEIKEFCKRKHISFEDVKKRKDLIFREAFLTEGDRVYILGNASKQHITDNKNNSKNTEQHIISKKTGRPFSITDRLEEWITQDNSYFCEINFGMAIFFLLSGLFLLYWYLKTPI